MRPSVCVIIPCYNHGSFLPEAVQSALNQHNASVHITIVNDGSTDDTTPAVCDQLAADNPNVSVVHQSNQGLPAARNNGVAAAPPSDYLTFLDADDTILPHFVSCLHRALTQARANGINASHAYCQERLTDLGSGLWRVPAWDPVLMLITNIHPVTTLICRDVFEQTPGFNTSMTLGYEDWDFWLTLIEHNYAGVRVPEPLFHWRRHAPDTMVMEAVKRHDQLFRTIYTNHRALYDQHAAEIIARSNLLLRNADANWLDEDHQPISINQLKNARNRLKARVHAVTTQVDALQHENAALRQQLAAYRAKPVVRASHTLHQTLDRLPPLVRTPLHWVANTLKRSLSRAFTSPEAPPASR